MPTPEPADSPKWFVCHTKPRCEKKFADLLKLEKFEYYLPLVTSIRKYQHQTKRFTKPLFPSYVFAFLDPEKKHRIYQQDLLVRVLAVENEILFLRQLEAVRALIESGLELSLHPILKKGTHVRVVGGPLHGLEGVVDDPAQPTGVVVAVDVLQQGVLIRLAMDNLEILP